VHFHPKSALNSTVMLGVKLNLMALFFTLMVYFVFGDWSTLCWHRYGSQRVVVVVVVVVVAAVVSRHIQLT